MLWRDRLPPADTVAAAATLLCFSGSSLYLVAPLRPFHLGLLLAVLLFAYPSFRHTVLRSNLPIWCTVFLCVVALQRLWVPDPGRYAAYAIFVAMACVQMMLGLYMGQRGRHVLVWGLAVAAGWAAVLAAWPDAAASPDPARAQGWLTAGPWGNVNNMAVVLAIINMIHLLVTRKVSWLLMGLCCLYCVALNCRACLIAVMGCALLYVACYIEPWPRRARFLAAWLLTVLLSISALSLRPVWFGGTCGAQAAGHCRVGAVPATTGGVSDAARRHDPGARAVRLAQAGQPVTVVQRGKPAVHAAAPAKARVRKPYYSSLAVRRDLLAQMRDAMTSMPWWQWVAGLGAGQLNLTWLATGAAWASPHLFWWEAYFHLGLAWPVFLVWLFLRSDGRARLALATIGLAGVAPSSMMYLQPLWFFLGVLYAFASPPSTASHSPRTAARSAAS